MPYWDERFAAALERHPGLASEQVLIDALAAMVVLDPGRFDVIVASNLFGDILSDLTAAVAGSIGIAPSANLNPEREHPSMFEPVHGSAPDIAGRGDRQPARSDLVRRPDARAPRRARSRDRRAGGHRGITRRRRSENAGPRRLRRHRRRRRRALLGVLGTP